MEYWWKENRGFALAAGGIGMAALLWYFMVQGCVQGRTQAVIQDRKTAEATLRAQLAQGVPEEDVLVRARRDTERLSKLLEEAEGDLELNLGDGFRAPAGRPAGEYFMDLRVETARKLQEEATRSNVAMPAKGLGFPEGMDSVSDELGEEMLARLAIVERVLLGALRSGITRIESVDPMGGANPDEGTVLLKGRFDNRLRVTVRSYGSSRAIFQWLHGLQKKGAPLIVAKFAATRENAQEDHFSADVAVEGVLLDPAGRLAEEKP